MKLRLAIGIGCRTGASASAIVDLVRRCLVLCPVHYEASGLFTIDSKAQETALLTAATEMNWRICFLPLAKLQSCKDRILTQSARIEGKFGVGSIAEAAALAGLNDQARLFLPRRNAHGVSCAIAIEAFS